MAAPSISTYILSSSSHYYGSEGGAAVMTSPSDSVTKVSAIISQTSGGAAIETVDTTVKTSSDQFADRWALTWPTAGITASPYYVRMWATNSDGDGAVCEVAPYIYFPPSVSVTSPADGSTLTDSSVTMAWTAADDYGISYQRVSVSHDGTELWGAEVEGNSIAVPSSVVFEDGESYSFSVMARNGKGMESTATNTASFSFVAPSVPALVIAEGDGKSASITVTDSSYTESGTVLEASSAMMESLTIDGASVQDGTPTPSAPVAIKSVRGNNLLLFTDEPTYKGAQSQWTDGTDPTGWYSWRADTSITTTSDSIRFQASSAAADALVIPFSEPPKPNTYYNISFAYRGTVEVAQMYVLCRTSPNAAVTSTYFDKSGEWTWFERSIQWTNDFSARKPYALMIPYTTNAQGWLEIKFASMTLTEGYAPSAYAPYGSVAVASQGKNTCRAILNWNSSSTNGNALFVMADLRPSTTYTLSFVGAVGHMVYTNGNIVTQQSSITCTGERQSVTFTTKDTLPETQNPYGWLLLRNSAGNTVMPAFTDVQLEIGSTATAYEPYSSTTTPIPVTLRSLPDGTRDELRAEGGNAVLVKRCEETLQAVTDGVTGTVGVDVLSATGEIANGVQVVYKLAAPQEIDLGTIALPYVDGSAWVDAEVTPNIEATFRPVDFPDQPAADSIDVIRVNADGSTWTVASNLTMGDTVTDPLPPLGVDAVYKAVGKTSAGGMSEKLFMHGIPSTGWVLNFGDAAQETVGFIYNPQATMTLAQGGESYHFADGGMGGGLPVFYPTTDRDASGTLAFDTVLYGDSDRLLDLCRRYPVAWLRDPFGHRWRAHVRPSVSHGVGQVWPVTLSWDAVRFEEV